MSRQAVDALGHRYLRRSAIALAAVRALLAARGVLALWRMRSSAGTPTGLEPDLWIVAQAITRLCRRDASKRWRGSPGSRHRSSIETARAGTVFPTARRRDCQRWGVVRSLANTVGRSARLTREVLAALRAGEQAGERAQTLAESGRPAGSKQRRSVASPNVNRTVGKAWLLARWERVRVEGRPCADRSGAWAGSPGSVHHVAFGRPLLLCARNAWHQIPNGKLSAAPP